jgi:hypothetical protein
VSVSSDAGNTLRYLDVANGNTGSSAGSIIRLITSNAAGTTSTSVDIVKYKFGALTINNNETNSAAYTSFGVGASERMRITSAGNLLVGVTSPIGARIESEATAGLNPTGAADAWKKGAFIGRGAFGGALSFINTGGASDGFIFYLTGNPSQLNLQFGANGGTVSNGVYLSSTATSWAAQSDERLKNIQGQIENAVQSISVLRPVKYTFKSDQSNILRVGLIAQDVQRVLPEVVDTDDKGFLGVRYSEVVPLLVAAIKELHAEIESLKQRIN